MAAKIFIPFYSRTGTVEALARAVAEGAEAEGAEVRLARARELVGHDIMSSVPGWKESAQAMNARYPAPTPEDAVWADGIVFGTPTRFGSVASELKAYIDGLGGLWAKGALERQGRRGLHRLGHAPWRQRVHHYLHVQSHGPSGSHHRAHRLCRWRHVQRRRHALWAQRRFRQSACRSHSRRAGRRPLPGPRIAKVAGALRAIAG